MGHLRCTLRRTGRRLRLVKRRFFQTKLFSKFLERKTTLDIDNSTFLPSASIGNPILNRSLATQNFSALKGRHVIISKNIATKKVASETSFSANTRASSGNRGKGNSPTSNQRQRPPAGSDGDPAPVLGCGGHAEIPDGVGVEEAARPHDRDESAFLGGTN